MTMENIPWAIGGGIVSPALARMLAYQATGGAEGVAGLGDFAVRQLAVAGGAVRISPGGAIMVNRYPGARNESYMCRAGDETQLEIPANAGTTTRYDLIIARVDDWNMPGGQATPATLPTNEVPAAKFAVITNVAANITKASQLSLNYPAIALARIALPAATSAVTTAMISSLREVAVPRRKRDLRAIAQDAGQNNSLVTTAAAGEQFPNHGNWTVEIPEWASEAKLIANWGSIFVPAGTTSNYIWVIVGYGRSDAITTQLAAIDFTAPKADPGRTEGAVRDTLKIPATMRGASVAVRMMGRKVSGSVNLLADWASNYSVDFEFVEAASEDV